MVAPPEILMDINKVTCPYASMKSKDWVKFLSPLTTKNDDAGKLIASKLAKGELTPEQLVAQEQRYLHLVREKVIQGNLFGVGLDTPIYRTMKCSDFHESLKSGTLFLVNPLKWAESGDSWENSILSGGVYLFNKNTSEQNMVMITEQIRGELNKWYAQSWSLTPECDAFWKRYASNGNRAVRISTTVGKLMHSIFDDATSYATTFMGRVRYLSESEIEESKVIYVPFNMEESIRSLLNLKRVAYAYENEVRLIYFDRDDKKMETKGQFVKIPAHGGLCSFIESIVLDPNCPKECLEAENSFLREHGYKMGATISKLNTPSLEPTVVLTNNVC